MALLSLMKNNSAVECIVERMVLEKVGVTCCKELYVILDPASGMRAIYLYASWIVS
jgi:hypothetical protein